MYAVTDFPYADLGCSLCVWIFLHLEVGLPRVEVSVSGYDLTLAELFWWFHSERDSVIYTKMKYTFRDGCWS